MRLITNQQGTRFTLRLSREAALFLIKGLAEAWAGPEGSPQTFSRSITAKLPNEKEFASVLDVLVTSKEGQ